MRIRNPKHARRFCRRNLVKALQTEDKKFLTDFRRCARFVMATETHQNKLVQQIQRIMNRV